MQLGPTSFRRRAVPVPAATTLPTTLATALATTLATTRAISVRNLRPELVPISALSSSGRPGGERSAVRAGATADGM